MWNFKSVPMALAAMLAACWPLIVEPLSSPARAGDSPSPTHAAETAAPVASRSTQPELTACVLLRNDNVLFGIAEQVGEFVIVQTGQGGEIKLARQDVLCWAKSVRHLYRYRVDHRQPGDLSALVRDARWCLRYDLYDLAAQEIRRILAVDPKNREAQLIEDQLRRQTAVVPTPSNDVNVDVSGPIRIVGYEHPQADQEEESSAVNLATLRRFASHVQPMLTNRCGRCHDASHHDPEGWTITLPPTGARASSRMTRDNLATTLTYVDSGAPDASVLLTKATSPHGGNEAPLDARNAKAIQSLRAWLWMAASSMIQSSADEESFGESAATDSLGGTTDQSIEPRTMTVDGFDVADRDASNRSINASPNGPARLPQVNNPFDPDLFNRRFHLEASHSP